MKKRCEQTGETLVEILVSTTLLGIVGIGIIGAIASVLISTDIDRKSSQSEVIIRSFAASIQRAPFRTCATPANFGTEFSAPDPFVATVTDVSYWDGTRPTVVPTVSPAPKQSSALNFGPCSNGTDHGLQQVKLEVSRRGASRLGRAELTIVKRDPDAVPPASAP